MASASDREALTPDLVAECDEQEKRRGEGERKRGREEESRRERERGEREERSERMLNRL